MRDRLRAVECPADIIDQIGGWSRKGVGESYGRGYQVEQCTVGWRGLWGSLETRESKLLGCVLLWCTALIYLNHNLVSTQKPRSAGVIIE